jgi:hypothetical protein
MARKLRYVGEGNLVEVSNSIVQGLFLMKPEPELTAIIIGVLGRAQALYGVLIHAFVFLSNHFHMLLTARDAKQLSSFMCYLDSNVGKETGRHSDWGDRIWARRFHSMVISSEPEAQVARLKYLLSNGCKEGLVARPQDWKGPSCAQALLDGRATVEGRWFDRTKEYRAKQAGREETHSTVETVKLSPLPCWADLEPEDVQRRVREIVEEIERETAAMHEENGTKPLGMNRVVKQHPHSRPKNLERSPAPSFYAATKKAREALRVAYRVFLEQYRVAAEQLKSGDFDASFPVGSFPPPRPFVVDLAPG